jgi:hypothetical protein
MHPSDLNNACPEAAKAETANDDTPANTTAAVINLPIFENIVIHPLFLISIIIYQ